MFQRDAGKCRFQSKTGRQNRFHRLFRIIFRKNGPYPGFPALRHGSGSVSTPVRTNPRIPGISRLSGRRGPGSIPRVWHHGRKEQGGKTLAPYGLGHPYIGGIRKHEGADFRRIQAAHLEAARPVGDAHLPSCGVRAVHQQPQNTGHLVKGGRHGIRSALPCGIACAHVLGGHCGHAVAQIRKPFGERSRKSLEHKGLPGKAGPGQHQARRQRPGLP